MQLQILSAALQFCVVVGLWSIYVADWQLAFANVSAAIVGYRWLRHLRAKRACSASGVRGDSSPHAPSRSAASKFVHKPLQEAPRSQAHFVPRAVENDKCSMDRSDPNSSSISGSTVAVAAAFLTAFAEARETKADTKQRPAEAINALARAPKQCATSDTVVTSQTQARRAVEVPQQPKPRRLGVVRQSAADTISEVDAEAERAARRAEMELLELLDAEASVQQPPRKKTNPAASTTSVRGVHESSTSGTVGRTDPGDAVNRATAVCADNQVASFETAPRKGEKHPQRLVDSKSDSRGQNKDHKPAHRQTEAKTHSLHQNKACESALAAEVVDAAAAVTPRRQSEKSIPASVISKKELRRRRAGQKSEGAEDEEDRDIRRVKSQQKDDGLAAVLSAVAKSNALNASRAVVRTQSEALSSTTMGSSGSTSSLTSPASIIADSEASSDAVLAETSGTERRQPASSLEDCESTEERSKLNNKSEELAAAWSSQIYTADAAEGAESMDGEVADWVHRIQAVDDYFDFSDLQGARSHESHSHMQVQLRDEVTRSETLRCLKSYTAAQGQYEFNSHVVQDSIAFNALGASRDTVCATGQSTQMPAPMASYSDSGTSGQQCVRELFPLPSQPAGQNEEGAGLAAELRAIFPGASIHIGPPTAEGAEIPSTTMSTTPPPPPPPPQMSQAPATTTQSLIHAVHYSSSTSSITSAGIPSTISSVPLPNDLSTVGVNGTTSSFNVAGHIGAGHGNGLGSISQNVAPGLSNLVAPPGPTLFANGSWERLSQHGPGAPPGSAIGNHCGNSSAALGEATGTDGGASSVNPPLAAEVLFNLPAASLGPTPTGALSVTQVEASTKASAWRAQLRRNGVQHLTEVEQALRLRDTGPSSSERPTSSETMCGTSTYAPSCLDGHAQIEGQSWHADPSLLATSDGVMTTQWMQEMMPGEHLNPENVPRDMMPQDMMSQRWSMQQQQQRAELPFAAPNMDLMGACSDAAMDHYHGIAGGQEQIGASEVWRDQSLFSAASAPPKLWENQAASLAPQHYVGSQAQYQAAYDEMYKSILVARLEAAVPESYED